MKEKLQELEIQVQDTIFTDGNSIIGFASRDDANKLVGKINEIIKHLNSL